MLNIMNRKINKSINKNYYHIFVLILLGAAIVFSVVIVSYFSIFNGKDSTYLGTIAISNYREDQYANVINSQVLEWEDDADYSITYQNIKLNIDLSYFDLDLTQTISNIKKNQHNDLYFTISQSHISALQNDLAASFSTDVADQLNFDQFLSDIINDIGNMNILKDYHLKDYFSDSLKDNLLEQITISNISPQDVDAIEAQVSEIKLPANQRFYLLKALDDYNLTDNQLSIIASGIEKVSLDSHLGGYIFEQNYDIPAWAEFGANVRILKVNDYDFSLYNDFNYDLTVEIVSDADDSLSFKLLGYPYVYQYSTEVSKVSDIGYETLYVDDEAINASTPNVNVEETDQEYVYSLITQAGVDGSVYKIEKTVIQPDLTETKAILFYEVIESTPQIIHENTVEKGGN